MAKQGTGASVYAPPLCEFFAQRLAHLVVGGDDIDVERRRPAVLVAVAQQLAKTSQQPRPLNLVTDCLVALGHSLRLRDRASKLIRPLLGRQPFRGCEGDPRDVIPMEAGHLVAVHEPHAAGNARLLPWTTRRVAGESKEERDIVGGEGELPSRQG